MARRRAVIPRRRDVSLQEEGFILRQRSAPPLREYVGGERNLGSARDGVSPEPDRPRGPRSPRGLIDVPRRVNDIILNDRTGSAGGIRARRLNLVLINGPTLPFMSWISHCHRRSGDRARTQAHRSGDPAPPTRQASPRGGQARRGGARLPRGAFDSGTCSRA